MSEDKDIAIRANNIQKSFRLPHEAHSGLKQLIINLAKGKKGYERQHVLKGIDFEIKKGEFFGIVGRNGSGKSTLLKCLAGIYTPNSGYVKVNGSLTPFIELGVGFNPELTGRENLYLNGALLGFSHKQMEDKYKEIVEFAELERFMDQKLKNYSSGMQVRLAFSIAIRAQPDILILDEVLAVGDAAFQQKCYDYFEMLKAENKTIVLVTHSMDAVKRFCSRAALIENGQVKKIGSPVEVADAYTIANIEPGSRSNAKDPNSFVEKLDVSLDHESYERGQILNLSAKYSIRKKFDVVLGITILKEGRSVAEINSLKTELDNRPNVKHLANLSVDLKGFNPGFYTLDIVIFNRETMKILDFKVKACQFLVKGSDRTRGGSMYIDGPWTQ